jgi:TonB family protein
MTLPFDQPALAAPPTTAQACPAGVGTPALRPRRALAALVMFVAMLHAVVIWCAWQGHAVRMLLPQDQAMDVSLLTAEPSSGRSSLQDSDVKARQVASRDGARQSVPRVAPAEPLQATARLQARADAVGGAPKAEAAPLPHVLSDREAQVAAPVPMPTMAPQVVTAPADVRTGGAAEAGVVATSPRHLSSSAVSYAVPPAKIYPNDSRSLDESGVVQLGVLVDEKGRVAKVLVERSSGYSRLDRAAETAARGARFNPYVEAGSARAFWVTIPFKFDLED